MKKLLKMLMVSILGVSMLVGCDEDLDIAKVSLAQVVEHKSLNIIRDSFLDEMKILGYKDGENVEIDYKNACGQSNMLDTIMSTFEGNGSDVIVAIATPTASAAAKYSKKIPVVFSAVSDPIACGFVDDLKKPNKNITGTSDEIQVDQILDLALQVDPNLKTLGFIYNTAEANSISNLKKVKAYCKQNQIELKEASGANISELQSALSSLMSECDAIFAPNDNTVASSMAILVKEAKEHKIPLYCGADSMVMDGGFASVGIDYEELGRESARMVDQVLKGKAIKDIPVKVFKDDLNIYVNKHMMQALNITLPKEVLQNERLIFIE